VTRESGK